MKIYIIPDIPTAFKNGYVKGVVFTNRLGYNMDNCQELKSEILNCAPLYPSKHILTDEYGEKYEQKIMVKPNAKDFIRAIKTE